MPEELRQRLLSRGIAAFDIGNICLDLRNGQITRSILLDNVEVARPVFPTGEIDWGIVADALPV